MLRRCTAHGRQQLWVAACTWNNQTTPPEDVGLVPMGVMMARPATWAFLAISFGCIRRERGMSPPLNWGWVGAAHRTAAPWMHNKRIKQGNQRAGQQAGEVGILI